jgi:cytochrome o ubiquinol oxidase subunit I
LYALGLMGATRRMQHYADLHWQPLMLIALAGAGLILLGIVLTAVQLAVSIRSRNQNRDLTGDPWDGRTLEWSTASPPPAWNFTHLPQVERADAYWNAKKEGTQSLLFGPSVPATVHVPRNTPVGVFIAFFAVVLGFALIWRIDWLAVIGLVGAIGVGLRHAWQTDREVVVGADEIATFERLRAKEAA